MGDIYNRLPYKGLHRYKFQKKSNLKEMLLVRYADYFKIFCSGYKSAQKIYNSVRLWLNERLKLEINSNK